jgi:hypothetical protein
MSSEILEHFNVDFVIEETDKDGDCFYSAVSKQLMNLFDVSSLRLIVSEHIKEEDVELFNIINDTRFSLQKLKKEIRKHGELWADSIEINALSRSMPRLCIYIFDEEHRSILKICRTANRDPVCIFLRRHDFHYESIRFREMDKMRIIHFMKNRNNFTLQKQDEKKVDLLLIMTLISIPCSFILFKFFDNSLKHWHKVCTKEI